MHGASSRWFDTGSARSTKVLEAMIFKRIDHVEIVTDQLARTVQFYTEVLGFTVKARDRIERSGLADCGKSRSVAFRAQFVALCVFVTH
jgi:hypothetical protein